MTLFTRRDVLTLATGAIAGAVVPDCGHAGITVADVAPPRYEIEKDATLRVLRPAKYVDPDETIFRANTKKFTDATGVAVRVDFVGFEDLRPQTAVAANTGAGPDIVVAWPDDPHVYVDRIVEMTDLADYLGAKYGGWHALPKRYGRKWGTNTWIGLPMGGGNGPCVYRVSWVKQAGFDTIPDDLDQFLTLCRNLKEIGHPAGFALGNAVGDANNFCNWLLWSHGGFMVDEEGHVAINRPETLAALDYVRELYPLMIPGTLSWQDPSNNKAFAAGEISLTFNGVSIYFAIKNNPKTAAMAEDIDHAHQPFGSVGKEPSTVLMLNAMLFRHSLYPNAAKEYLRFMMEAEQYEPWLTGCVGYWGQPLRAYDMSAVWDTDRKLLPYRDACKTEFWNGYKGPISAASGAVNAEYINVHMFAAVASGQSTAKDALAEAERRARRYYKT